MKYRQQLDALRGFAVILVLLFHCNIRVFSRGFVGVDVFFVLSGFLISSLLLEEISERGTVDLLLFYAKRARRLLPESFLVLMTVCGCYYYFNSSALIYQHGSWFLGPAFYVANWVYISEATDYWSENINKSPTLHYWSLSAEEQFYLGFPVVLMILAFFLRRYMLWIFLFMLIIALSLHLFITNPSVAHMSTIFRLYQLLLGIMVSKVMLVIVEAKSKDHDRESSDKKESNAISSQIYGSDVKFWFIGFHWIQRYSKTIQFAGVAVIVLFSSSFTNQLVSNDSTSIICSFSTALVILGIEISLLDVEEPPHVAPQQSLSCIFISKVLMGFTFVGKHSYGIYLWHWPFIVFGSEMEIFSLSGSIIESLCNFTIVFSISMFLALLNFRLLELISVKQISFSTKKSQVLAVLVSIGLPLLFLVGFHVLFAPSYSNNGGSGFVPLEINYKSADLYNTTWMNMQPKNGNCTNGQQFIVTNKPRFPKNDFEIYNASSHDRPIISFIGDSHAAMFRDAARAIAADLDLTVIHFARRGCGSILVTNGHTMAGTWELFSLCASFYEGLFQVLDRYRPSISIVFHSTWSTKLTELKLDGTDTIITNDDPRFEKQYLTCRKRFMDKLLNHTNYVIGLVTAPEVYDIGYAKCVSLATTCEECDFSLEKWTDSAPFISEYRLNQLTFRDAIEAERARIVNIGDVLCPNKTCPSMFDDYPVWVDQWHIHPKYWVYKRGMIIRALESQGVSLMNQTLYL